MKKGYKQTEVGVIPEDWEVKELGEICYPSKRRINPITTSENYKCVELEHLAQGSGILLGHANSEDLRSQKSFFVKGDVLFGKLRPYLRKYFFADFDGVCTTEIWVLKTAINNSNSYLYQLVQSDKIIEAANLSTGTKMPRAEWKTVSETKIPLPPTITEQTAIATALSDMDQLIAGLEQLIAKKKAIKQGAMQELLRPKEGWVLKKLGDLTKVFTKQTGFDYSAYIKPSLVQIKSDDTIPFIQNKDFNNKWINYNTDYFIPLSVALQFPKILLDEKCLLISISGSIGNIGVYESESLAFIGGAIAILKFQDEKIIDWIMYYLKSNDGQNKLFGSVKSGSHQNLILDDIRKVEVPIPSIEEQIRITNTLSDMEIEIGMLNENLEKYRLLKQGMMQELLTGKTRLV